MTQLRNTTLVIAGLMYLGFGLIFIVDPSFLKHAYITTNHPTGLMEIRAFYGGLEIGLGLFLLRAVINKSMQTLALQLLTLILGFTILGRLVGMLADGISGNYLWYALIIETPILIAAITAASQKRT